MALGFHTAHLSPPGSAGLGGKGDIFSKIAGPNSGCMLTAGLEKEKKVGKERLLNIGVSNDFWKFNQQKQK